MAITIVHDADIERRDDDDRDAMGGDFRDTWLNEESPTVNVGDSSTVRCGRRASGGKGGDPSSEYHAIFRYDLTKFIPADATITAAEWWIYVNSTGASAVDTFQVYTLTTQGWVEDEATWDDYKTGSAWPVAGGDGVAPSVVVTGMTTTGWKNVTVTTMVAAVGIANFLLARTDGLDTTTSVTIRSKEAYISYPQYVHHLRITYTLDGKTFEAMVH